jgi:ribosome biogenesis GTPase / thiamine phosphate phosphatase
VYSRIGYPVLYTSTKVPTGIESLRDRLCGATSVLTGPSGVGKSSLLNLIQPGLGLRVAAISEAVLKGRHTTVTAQLIPLDCGGYVADTPGLRELGLWGVEEDELDFCFPEMRPFLGDCRYGSSCSHSHEPNCAVKAAVERGDIDPRRYESYRRLLAGEEEDG